MQLIEPATHADYNNAKLGIKSVSDLFGSVESQ